MIPRTIHYCWFGGRCKPSLVERCIASWRKFCPDFELREWNERNVNLRELPFAEAAYRHGKWSFVADQVEFRKVLDEGGVYFDTDVELLAPIDDLLEGEGFFACERDDPKLVAPGLGFAAPAGSAPIRAIVERYDRMSFDPACHMSQSSPMVVTDVLADFPEARCLPMRYFNPKGGCAGKVTLTDDTRAIHHYSASWFNWKQRAAYLWLPKVKRWFLR